MNVYILVLRLDYEASDIIGVFTTYGKAKDKANAFINSPEGYGTEWRYEGDGVWLAETERLEIIKQEVF